MQKTIHQIILVSLFSIFSISCSVSPTYSRKNIESVIKNICKNEFKVDVKVWETGNTIWIYAPFATLLDPENKFEQTVSSHVRKIFLTLKRVILSMDNPPKFYAFVCSGTAQHLNNELAGIDVYYIGYIPDMVKYEMSLISTDEMQEREYFNYMLNPQAIGDTEGIHIQKYDLTMGEFISLLIKQDMERKFSTAKIKANFEIETLRTYYFNEKLGIIFNIDKKAYTSNLPYPFDEAKKSIIKFIKMYEFKDVIEVEINDIINQKVRFYTLHALLNE